MMHRHHRYCHIFVFGGPPQCHLWLPRPLPAPSASLLPPPPCCQIGSALAASSVMLTDAGFGPQKLAVLAAYSLRQGLLVWLKTYKADVELRQNIDPTVGVRAPSISGRSNIDRAAAAAMADAQAASGSTNPRAAPFSPMDIMLETDAEGVLDSGASQRQSNASTSRIDPFLDGSNAVSLGRSQNGRETDPLVGFASPSSRSLQGPTFSSNAFPSFSSNSPFDGNSPVPQQTPASPFTSAANSEYGSIPHSNSTLSVRSPTSPTGLPKPGRAPPPPPPKAPVPASPFSMISPFAQPYQSAAAAGFPPLDRVNSGSSIQSAISERERRPTVRFADTPSQDTVPPSSRTYHHTNSGFTELAMSRGGSSLPPPPPQAPGHSRSRSDLPQASRPNTQRSLSRNKSLSKQERAASLTLDALELPPLPLPAEAGTEDAASPVVSPSVSRQPSRQMSLSVRTLSGFR